MADIPTREEFMEMVYNMRDQLVVYLQKAEADGSEKEANKLRRLVARANRLIVRSGGQP